ncbi:MAG: hypothetical protein JW924_03110 [Fusobacteriaceae bacterium]|nr:hypothetical protein [Fusobacteriaceae bacterium]
MFIVLVKYEDSIENSYEVRKERLKEVILRVSEIDNLEYIKIIPQKNKPSLKNNFEI